MMYVQKCMIYCIKFDRKQILYKIEKKNLYDSIDLLKYIVDYFKI